MSTDLNLPELTPGSDIAQTELVDQGAAGLAPVFDVPINIQAVLGRASLEVAELLRLNRGSVIELDRKVGEAIDIYVNNRLVARRGGRRRRTPRRDHDGNYQGRRRRLSGEAGVDACVC
jgi:flagellar motor switch protein FliN/FliY